MASCWNGLFRFLLVLINILFMLLGMAFLCLGLVLRFGRKLYEPFLEFGIFYLKKVLKDTRLADFDVDSINLGEVMTNLSIALIVGGLIIFALAMVGSCGACYKIRFMLWMYAFIVIAVVVVEVVVLTLLCVKPELVKDNIKESIKNYKGIASSEIISLAWNIIMIQFRCCGVDDFTDFKQYAKLWVNPITVGANNIALETPIACCKTLPVGQDPENFSCASKLRFDINLSNAAKGCFKVIWDQSLTNTAVSVPVIVFCGIIQLLFIIFSIIIAKEDG